VPERLDIPQATTSKERWQLWLRCGRDKHVRTARHATRALGAGVLLATASPAVLFWF
jgi:hypothetical protein